MRHLLALTLIMLALLPLGSYAQVDTPAEPEPGALLAAAVDQLQAAASFRLAIAQTGEPYPLALTFDGVNMLPASLESAEAQYVQPNELHISAWVRLLIPLSLEIYSRDDRQWLSFPGGAPWLLLPAFEDFDVNRLLAPEDGIENVMANLEDPRVVALDPPPDEAEMADTDEPDADPALTHIKARAAGDLVSVLLFGFIEPKDDVDVIVSLSEDDGNFAEIEITMLETLGDPEKEPSVWHIRFYDYDAPRGFEPPDS